MWTRNAYVATNLDNGSTITVEGDNHNITPRWWVALSSPGLASARGLTPMYATEDEAQAAFEKIMGRLDTPIDLTEKD